MKKLFIILLLGFATCSVYAQSEIVIAGDNVCLRSEPNEYSKLTGQYNPHFNTGQYLKCAGTVGGYYKVVYNGGYYYIPTQYARPRGSGSSSVSNSPSRIVIAGDNVCLRTAPNEYSKLSGPGNPHLNTGYQLRCVGQTSGYYKVVYNGSYYYIPKQYGRPRY